MEETIQHLFQQNELVQSPINEPIATDSSVGIIEKMSNYVGDFLVKAQSEPHLGGLVLAGIGVVLLVAVIMNADWILDARGQRRSWLTFMLENADRDIARIIMAIP